MRSFFLPALYIIYCSISAARAAECHPSVISLPFERKKLSNGAEARGVSWAIGGSKSQTARAGNAQTVVLLPSPSFNDSYVYGANGLCATNVSVEECTTYRGGIYNFTRSESATSTDGGSIKHVYDNVTAAWKTDYITMSDTVNNHTFDVASYVFGIRDGSSHRFVNQGELGLGSDSVLLNRLSSGTKEIASKSYSFFWGSDIAVSDNPRSGSLTLGGYDQALIADGRNITTSFDRTKGTCREGMIVDLTGMTLQSPNGTTQTILDKSEKMQVCIVPTFHSIMNMREKYWNKTASGMGLEYSPDNNGESEGLLYHVASIIPESAKFDGNLTITLNDAVTITIPNKQLILDEPYIGSNGLILRNTSRKVVPIRPITDTAGMPALGGMFFSAAYLMVNHDKSEFTIAAVNENPSTPQWVGIDTANNCESSLLQDTPDDAKPSSPEPSSSARLSSGAIVGIVIGAIAVMASIAGVFFLIWRRKRRTGLATPKTISAELSGEPTPEKSRYNVSEMHAHHVAEFSADQRDYARELDGTSKPAEVHGWGAGREEITGQRRW